MNKNKQLAVNMAAQMLTFTLNIAISFFLTPFILQNIGEAAYGFIGLANNFISYAGVLTVALNSMASRFITISIHKNEYNEVNRYMSSITVANAALSLFFSVAAVVILANLNRIVKVPDNILQDVTVLWGLLFLGFFITLIGGVFDVATFAHDRLDLAAVRNAESSVFRAGILFLMYSFFAPNVWYVGLSAVLCNCYVVGMNIHYTKKFMPYVKIRKKYIDIKKIVTLISSGIWNSLSKLSGILSNGLDLLITNVFVSASAMGIVSVAKIIPTYVLAAFGTIAGVFAPQLTISYAKDNLQKIEKQLNQAVKLLSFIAAIPVSCYYVFGQDLYSLWLPTQNAQLLSILGIITSLAWLFVLPLEPLWNIFTVTNKVKVSSLFLLINSAATIMITYILLLFAKSDFMKMCIVCGVSTVFSIIRALTFLPIYGAKCLGMKWYTFYKTIGKAFVNNIIGILLAGAVRFFLAVNSWMTLFLALGITTMLICAVNYFAVFNKTERKLIINMLLRRKGHDT